MSITLGQAYVQIMPSAKGISGSIQKQLNPEATKVGRSAGVNIANSIADSINKSGKKLTKAITMPVLGATTAVAGLVGALGFKRLIGIDNAQAKLKGLGYEGKQLEIIMNNARNAVQGTTFATSEGADVAAGALAAGIKEGAELERYIKLVGDAAIGSNRPIADMAMIFNRVQGSGRLMTQELNMIEHGMPGFSQAIAKHLGVSIEELRKMATAGEITTKDFLDTMESFAGGMSAEYAKTFSGLKDNVLANIGIIGEALLEGLFEDGKEGLANFLDYLRNSDDLKKWATETGESLRSMIKNIVESVKSAVNWWKNLSDGTKDLILKVAGIAIVIGPVLMAVSKLITIGITLGKVLGAVKVVAGIVATAIGALSWPVVAVVAAIAGLIGIFVALYNENERFREIVSLVWEEIKNVIMTVVETVSDFVMGIVGGLVDWWQENNELILESARVVWEAIKDTIMAVLEFMLPMIKTAWEGIKNNIAAAWDLITTIVETGINFVKGIIKAVMQMITGDWSGAWETIKSTVSGLITGIKDIISKQINLALTIIRGVLDNIKAKFSAIFNSLKNIVGTAFTAVKNSIKRGMDTAYNTVTGFFGKFKKAGKKIVTSITDGIKGAIGGVGDAIGGVAGKIRNFLPFSPAKEGPLRDLDKLDFGGTISLGIDDGASEVEKAMDEMLSMPFRPSFHNEGASSAETLNNMPQLLMELIDAVRDGQNISLFPDGGTFAKKTGKYTSFEGGNRVRRAERGLA